MRAQAIAAGRPAAAEVLSFYAAVAAIQEALLRDHRRLFAQPSYDLDRDALRATLPGFLDALTRQAPALLAGQLSSLKADHLDLWLTPIETYRRSGGRDEAGVDAVRIFVIEALLQPFAEVIAIDRGASAAAGERRDRCPGCTGLPVVALLREEAHGARRSLVCGLCLTEWAAPRLLCAACGESRFESLPVFRADEFTAVRVDACESCHAYIKTIDLTRDGAALAIPDDLASLPLDLWAREQGYRRIRPNLLRL